MMAAASGGEALAAEKAGASNQVLKSAVYDLKDLKVYNTRGDSFIPVFEGDTHTGYHLTVHETTLAPGAIADRPEHHADEELFMVREGVLEIEISGIKHRVGPGSIAYVASNDEHSTRNGYNGTTSYFVILFGPRPHKH